MGLNPQVLVHEIKSKGTSPNKPTPLSSWFYLLVTILHRGTEPTDLCYSGTNN